MCKQPEISVIIPVYNLEEYIGATLQSLILQEGVRLEVLVIDDGSTDNTKSIVEKYVKKYPYIKLLCNERMKGVSGARNTALLHMTGETFFFLDGDDILPPHALAPLLAFMREQKAPLVRALLDYFCEQRWVTLRGVLSQQTDEPIYPEGTFTQHLYASDLAKKHNMLFPEGIIMAEDRVFFCEYFCYVNFIPTLEHYVYTYRINHKAVRASTHNVTSFITHFTTIQNLLDGHGKSLYYELYLKSQFTLEWLGNIYYAMQGKPEDIQLYLQACVDVLCDKEDVLGPALNVGLKQYAKEFWQACQEKDTQALLIALKKANIVQPLPSTYVGIKESQVQSKFWKFIRVLHRAKSLVQKYEDAKKVAYVLRLHRKARAFLRAM